MAENTKAMFIVLTNPKSENLSLVSCKVIGSSSTSTLDLPKTLGRGSAGDYGTGASTTPYQVIWSYSPDGGQTLLTFDCKLSGATGITVVPSKTGPDADNWVLAESLRFEATAWIVQFYYSPKA
jgi:hypothetical protein